MPTLIRRQQEQADAHPPGAGDRQDLRVLPAGICNCLGPDGHREKPDHQRQEVEPADRRREQCRVRPGPSKAVRGPRPTLNSMMKPTTMVDAKMRGGEQAQRQHWLVVLRSTAPTETAMEPRCWPTSSMYTGARRPAGYVALSVPWSAGSATSRPTRLSTAAPRSSTADGGDSGPTVPGTWPATTNSATDAYRHVHAEHPPPAQVVHEDAAEQWARSRWTPRRWRRATR